MVKAGPEMNLRPGLHRLFSYSGSPADQLAMAGPTSLIQRLPARVSMPISQT